MGFTMYFDNDTYDYVIQLGVGKKFWRFASWGDASFYFRQWAGHEPIYDKVCDGWH